MRGKRHLLYGSDVSRFFDRLGRRPPKDYSAGGVSSTDIYLYNRPQASGNRGIAVIALALVDGRGNAVGHVHWPRPVTSCPRRADPPNVDDLLAFVRTSRYVRNPNSRRPGKSRRKLARLFIHFQN